MLHGRTAAAMPLRLGDHNIGMRRHSIDQGPDIDNAADVLAAVADEHPDTRLLAYGVALRRQQHGFTLFFPAGATSLPAMQAAALAWTMVSGISLGA